VCVSTAPLLTVYLIVALYMINKNLTPKNILEDGEQHEYPDSVVNLFMGRLGYPHHGLNPAVAKKVLKKSDVPLTERPVCGCVFVLFWFVLFLCS